MTEEYESTVLVDGLNDLVTSDLHHFPTITSKIKATHKLFKQSFYHGSTEFISLARTGSTTAYTVQEII